VDALVHKICEDLKQHDVNALELFFSLQMRIGYEMGRLFKIFEENDMNWGFFSDHDIYGVHCNAHMNNFVVLPPPWSKTGNFLSVLDFDLAYSRKDFVHLLDD